MKYTFKNSLMVFITSFFIIYGFILILYFQNYSYNLDKVLFIIMYIYVFPAYLYLLISVYMKDGIRFLFIFIALSLIFYYGHQLCIAFGMSNLLENQHFSILDGRIGNKFIIIGTIMPIMCLLLLNMGYFLGKRIINPNLDNKTEINTSMVNTPIDSCYNVAFQKVGWMLFSITVIPAIIFLLYQINLYISSGSYAIRRNIEAETLRLSSGSLIFYIAYISKWFLPSCYMLMISYSKSKIYKRFVIFLLCYCLMYLLSGSRYELVKIICAMYMIHVTCVKGFTKKDLKWILPLLLFAVLLFKVVTFVRTYGTVSFGDYVTVANYLIKSNFWYSVFYETGITSISIWNIMEWCPEHIPYLKGLSIIGSLFSVLPGFLNPFDTATFNTAATFSSLYYQDIKNSYGSSFITEAYYNFGGTFVYFVVAIYGFIISKVVNKLDYSSIKGDNRKIFTSIYLLSELLYCVRNDVFLVTRYYVYYAVLPCIAVIIVTKLLSRNQYIEVKRGYIS